MPFVAGRNKMANPNFENLSQSARNARTHNTSISMPGIHRSPRNSNSNQCNPSEIWRSIRPLKSSQANGAPSPLPRPILRRAAQIGLGDRKYMAPVSPVAAAVVWVQQIWQMGKTRYNHANCKFFGVRHLMLSATIRCASPSLTGAMN